MQSTNRKYKKWNFYALYLVLLFRSANELEFLWENWLKFIPRWDGREWFEWGVYEGSCWGLTSLMGASLMLEILLSSFWSFACWSWLEMFCPRRAFITIWSEAVSNLRSCSKSAKCWVKTGMFWDCNIPTMSAVLKSLTSGWGFLRTRSCFCRYSIILFWSWSAPSCMDAGFINPFLAFWTLVLSSLLADVSINCITSFKHWSFIFISWWAFCKSLSSLAIFSSDNFIFSSALRTWLSFSI